jgi:hypothetical protein
MKSLAALVFVLSCLAGPCLAQSAAQGDGQTGGQAGGDVTLGSQQASTERQETCVQVEIGGQKTSALDCINQDLKREVEGVHPPMNIPPISASSPPSEVGGFSATAMSQQYGQNWGKSVIPFRPAPQVFVAPLR